MNVNGKNSILNRFSVLIVLLMSVLSASAQLTADFTMDKPGGCSPVTINFTNTSRGTTANTTYYWEFGNGNASTNRNASATYVDIKSYQVTLTVSDGSRTSSKTMQVVVSRKPVADFEVSAPSGCVPTFNPVFTSKSTTADGTLSEFVWEWGDGEVTRARTPATPHQYRTPIKPLVTLTVINSYGCAAIVQKQPTEVLPALTAAFTVDKTILCAVDDAVSFTNASTGPGNLSYIWNFGDNTTATTKNASHVYGKAGEYAVSLTANNDKGCTHTVPLQSGRINVATFRLDVSVPQPLCVPANSTSTTYFSTSTYPYTTNIQWKFSDEATPRTLITSSISKQVGTPGEYSVKATATFGTCPVEKEISYKVFTSPVLPTFSADIPKCGTPATVQYTDESTWAKKWSWSFNTIPWAGNNVSSADKTPSVNYNTDGSFSASLIATDENGCSASAYKTITLTTPRVTINVIKSTATNGSLNSCKSFDVTFGASSTIGTITSYKWNLSEGKTSNDAQPSNTFTTVARHRIVLEYTTSDGCTGTAETEAILNNGPTVDFTGTTSVCGADYVSFTGTRSIYSADYNWSFINAAGTTVRTYWGFNNNTASISMPDTGWYTVKYTVRNDGRDVENYCSNEAVKVAYLRVNPPFAGNISMTNDCDEGERGQITFRETTRHADEWEWDFGDGTPKMIYTKATKPAVVMHEYANTGRYPVTLTVKAGGCSFVATETARVLLVPDFTFTNDATVCGVNSTFFTNKGSNVGDTYIWTFENRDGLRTGGTAGYPNGITSFNFPDTGKFNGKLAFQVNNCRYEGPWEMDKIRVLPPYKLPPIGTKVTCNQNRGEVEFTAAAKGADKWVWQFGDGETATYDANTRPAIVKHAYKASGSYNINVTVTTGGCTDNMNASVSVLLKQNPILSAVQVAVCADKDLDITLTGFERNPRNNYPYASYYSDPQMQYENGTFFAGIQRSTVTEGPDWYRTSWTSTYTGSLGNLSREQKQIRAITRPYGFGEYASCPDTSNFVTMRIDGPTVNLNVLKNNACYKEKVIFEDQSTVPAGNSIVNRVWNFGDGQTASSVDARNPVEHLYSSVGNYQVSLKVTDNLGCSDTRTVQAVMAGPRASFSISPTPATNKNTVYFYNNSNVLGAGTTQYKWSFSYDGATSTASNPPSRTYPKGGPATDVVTLIATNPTTGCADTMTQYLPVVNVNNAFSMTKSLMDGGCLPALIEFNRFSTGYNNFKWDFGDGTTLDDPYGNLYRLGHIYEKPGVYKVTIYSSGIGSSKDTTIDSVVIKPLATAGNVQSSIQETCAAKPVTLTATQKEGATITWDYGDGVVATTQGPQTTYTYNTGGIYKPSITVKNADGCPVAATLNSTILVDSLNVKLQPVPSKICDSAMVDFNPVVRNLGAERLGRSLTYSWDFGVPGPANTSTATDPQYYYNKPGTYTPSLRVRSQAGCDVTATTNIKVVVTPQVILSAVSEICAGNNVDFYAYATPSAGVSWRWDFANGQFSSAERPGPVLFSKPDRYNVKLFVNNDGCVRETDHFLTVHALPVVNPLRDTVVVIGSVVPLRASGSNDIIRWSWSPGTFIECPSCAITTSLPRKHMKYEVTGINQNGCTASASMNIRLLCAETPIFVPNTFTPNKDGRNDKFYPRGKGVQMVTFFRVYNRLGEMIFERRNFQLNEPSQGWDGTWLGKPVSPGVFTWSSDMICDAGETFSMKGTITLLR